jgi:hypothetical protein
VLKNLFKISILSTASLLCFIFPVSVKGVIIFIIFDNVMKFSVKNSITLLLVEMDTDPDRQTFDVNPDPAK